MEFPKERKGEPEGREEEMGGRKGGLQDRGVHVHPRSRGQGTGVQGMAVSSRRDGIEEQRGRLCG